MNVDSRNRPAHLTVTTAVLSLVCLLSSLAPLPAADDGPLPNPFETDQTDRAIIRATGYLLSQQDPADGSISDTGNTKTALTALSVLSLASAGHQADYPSREGRTTKRAILFVLRPEHVDQNGFFGAYDKSQMYGHGISTLMLGEMLGQGLDEAMDRRIRERLETAVQLILRSQQAPKANDRDTGGWRYQPNDQKSDISVTVWQIMALRSAKNAGIAVPTEAIDKALQYLRNVYDSAKDSRGLPLDRKAGFAYYGDRKHVNMATTAMGLLSLQLAGDFDSPYVKGSRDWLQSNPPHWGQGWLFYGIYYYSQATYQLGGADAARGFSRTKTLLLPEQRPDGSWEASNSYERNIGSVYATSMALLALCVKNHYLPIYQR